MVRFNNNSQLFIVASNEKIDRILETIGLQAESYAKLLCPVDTGRLRNSITHTSRGKAGFVNQYADNEGNSYSYNVGDAPDNQKTVYIGTNVDYGPAIEFGTSKQKAQPYLKPAITNHNSEYAEISRIILKQ